MATVFLQIVNTAITAGWLVLAVILARLLLKKAPAWIKCALWAIVALRLVWPFSFESVLSLLPSAQTIPPSQLYASAPQINTGIGSVNSTINPVFSQTFRAETAGSVNPLQVALWVAGWIWVLGMVVMAVYAAISYLRIYRRVRFSVPEGEGVYLCEQIPAPFILGIIKPKIYLPSDLPRQNWDSILAHERGHLARRDYWWKPLGFLLLSVFWFHPLLWVAYILLCRDVELACDERVIKDLSAEEKQAYSNTLLECSLPKKWITACPLAFGETGVKQRIKAVLHYKKPTLWILIIALIACTVLAVGFLTEPKDKLITAEDVAGNMYVCSNIADLGPFVIILHEDGTFEYSIDPEYPYKGKGNWTMEGDILRLDEERGMWESGCIIYVGSQQYTYYFRVTEDALIFQDDGDSRFMNMWVTDGELFFLSRA